MNSKLNPYLNFNGRAKEAMEFYHSVFGGNLTMTTFKDGGMPVEAAEAAKIMHAQLLAANGMTLMASDTPREWDYKPGTNISISLSGPDAAELSGYWEALSEGASVGMPLAKAPWGDTFGMLDDRFGIRWLVNIVGQQS